MIVTNNKKDYELVLVVMRAHGWDRDFQQQNRIKTKKFNFIGLGF